MAGRSLASNVGSHAAIADGNWHSFGTSRGESTHNSLASTSHFTTTSFAHPGFAASNLAWRGGWHGGYGWHGGWYGGWGWGWGFAGWNWGWGWGWGCCGWGWGWGWGGWGWSPFWSWPAYWYNPYLDGYYPPPYALYPYPG
jgi:hypothetical protein